MNVSSVTPQMSIHARAEIEPRFVFSPVVLGKIATIAGMFAFGGVVTGWLLGTFPSLR
jgi:hypothetical protein